jgi:hypothetical protein
MSNKKLLELRHDGIIKKSSRQSRSNPLK